MPNWASGGKKDEGTVGDGGPVIVGGVNRNAPSPELQR